MSYSKEIYKEADAKLEAIRQQNTEQLQKRKKEIFERIPQYKAKKERLMDIIGNAVVAGCGKQKAQQLKESVISIENELEGLLRSNGYPENYLEDIVTCTKCSDRGYILNKRCSCYEAMLIEAAREHSNLKYVMDTKTEDNFDITVYSDKKPMGGDISPRQNIKYVYSRIKQFVDKFDSDDVRSLLFTGGTGLGKTFSASLTANALIKAGKSVFYQSASKLCEILEDYKFNRQNVSYNIFSVIDNINNCDLLIIDDLGSEFATNYTVSAIYEAVNKRLLENKKMIITTNLGIKGITEAYTTRLSSRIIGEFEILEFIGEDLRLSKMK